MMLRVSVMLIGMPDEMVGLDQHEKSKCASRISTMPKRRGVVSRVPMTSMLLLESRISKECTEAAVALCGGGGHGQRPRFWCYREKCCPAMGDGRAEAAEI